MLINFGDIPAHHNLFLDYLYEFENVKQFYKTNFRDKEEYLKKFKKLSEKQFNPEVAEIIKSQYQVLSPSKKTSTNISNLSEKNTFAIVTGQQLGILGGPLYTFYKIITAIKLSSYLNERYDDYKFVPVFWLEGDDHDFEEISYINFIDDNNNFKKIEYNDDKAEDENRGTIGKLKIQENINAFFNAISEVLRDTEFKPKILEKLKQFYSEGRTFKESFRDLIYWIFDEDGLVIFDPQDKKIKELLKPIFKKEVTDFRQHTEKLVHVSAKLEELYHAQVKVRPINLFLSSGDGRFSIEPVENEFRLKSKRKKFSYDELMDLIETEPENFSPNVLLRPICQDYLLPTAFYVAGPSEITYFAQVMPLYDFYKIESPIIYPRSSVTILENNISAVLEKYDLNIEDIFTSSEDLKEKVLSSLSDTKLDEIFSKTENDIEIIFDQLKEKLFEIDKTISDSSSKYREKIFHYLNELKSKASDAQRKRYEITLRQIDKVSNNIYPNGNLQERELNFLHYANKYGEGFLKKISDEIQINKFEHQIIKF